ncbi:glycerate kinase [Aquibacillus albus]|uniref:Glycerate kinase n=1 Tax=Aquibacillus albus TaxID=1168171 RepID=A0ABS2MWD5_9BACI|nr:glycerate kinase [Aquibacillus albus]MBM7570200.1 glycerate kinase [Aquibacillus albus]
MKVVISPDSFKGSISAIEFCSAVSNGILRVFPNASIEKIPLADGGEGTMENMVLSTGGTMRSVMVKGPLGNEVNASYGILGDQKTIVIEMAEASGLTLVEPEKRDPFIASSFGTGELIKHALNDGYRQFVIGLGGSATNDSGAGMLKALGMELFGKDGVPLPEGGGHLIDLVNYDKTNLDPRLTEASFQIASDVTNVLCGPKGASAIFGPQKGASPDMVSHLDKAINHFSDIVYKQEGVDMRPIIGGGAAGGMGAALVTFLDAEVRSGIDVVMEGIKFEEKIKGADLVITGEGKLDEQTLSGKVIAGVNKVTKKYQIPIIALCGGIELDFTKLDDLGLLSAFSIVPKPCSLEEAMDEAPKWVEERTESFMRVIRNYKNS